MVLINFPQFPAPKSSQRPATQKLFSSGFRSVLAMCVLASTTLIATADDEFATAGPMAASRYFGHTTTLLANGKVLVTGGANEVDLSNSELFDPTSGLWSATGSINRARRAHTATLLANGKVLITGGYYLNTQWAEVTLSSSELYDPATGLWTNAGTMGTARTGHTATMLPSGMVLVTGGSYYNLSDHTYVFPPSAELFDPTTNLWSAAGSMAVGRSYHKAALLGNGKVLIAGGIGSATKLLYASAELYNPTTNLWSAAVPMKTARVGHTATMLPDGKMLVSGGYSYLTNVLRLYNSSSELYDPSTGLWTDSGVMSATRGDHTATLLTDGRVLITGGDGNVSSGDYTYVHLASADVFDPATGLWTTTDVMDTARISHTAILLVNGKVLIAGGNSDGVLHSSELYTPATVIPLAITMHPTNATANQGAEAAFVASATGAITYHWQKDGVYIPGANGPTLNLSNVQASDVGGYRMIAVRSNGSVTSDIATLTVVFPPAIVTQPLNVSAAQGANAAFHVAYSGSASTCQWQKNGLNIPDATGFTLTMNSVQPTDSGVYSAVVSNAAGSAMSNPATLSLAAVYTQAQYETAMQSGLQVGMNAGRTQVLDAPNAYGLYSLTQVQAINVDVPLLAKDPVSGKFKLTIGVKKSTDLTHYNPFPIPSNAAFLNSQGEMEFQFSSPDHAAFFRVESH